MKRYLISLDDSDGEGQFVFASDDLTIAKNYVLEHISSHSCEEAFCYSLFDVESRLSLLDVFSYPLDSK